MDIYNKIKTKTYEYLNTHVETPNYVVLNNAEYLELRKFYNVQHEKDITLYKLQIDNMVLNIVINADIGECIILYNRPYVVDYSNREFNIEQNDK